MMLARRHVHTARMAWLLTANVFTLLGSGFGDMSHRSTAATAPHGSSAKVQQHRTRTVQHSYDHTPLGRVWRDRSNTSHTTSQRSDPSPAVIKALTDVAGSTAHKYGLTDSDGHQMASLHLIDLVADTPGYHAVYACIVRGA